MDSFCVIDLSSKNTKDDSTLSLAKPDLTFNLRHHPFVPTIFDFIKNLFLSLSHMGHARINII